MEQTWRWFGPDDPVPLSHVRQAGATGVVSALHQYYRGEVWPTEAIDQHRREIERAGLRWSVVESIPVPSEIKLGKEWAREPTERFCETMRRVAANGIGTICYNFMPVVDWTRTELRYPMPSGGLALRFDMTAFVAYDLFVLEREGAADDYPSSLVARAEHLVSSLSNDNIASLESIIISGLPGAEATHSRGGIGNLISRFKDTGPDQLRDNLIHFHKSIVPVAQELGIRLCIHPDDPPFSLFGLPRVVSTSQDLDAIFEAVPEPENGLTFCTGSLGARRDNDLVEILSTHAHRVHFVHLRNVSVEEDGSFVEDDHLSGDCDMVAVIAKLLSEERRRREVGRADHSIPFRPDHGHLLLDDQLKSAQPGYSAIGRMKGLAELRGVISALNHPRSRFVYETN